MVKQKFIFIIINFQKVEKIWQFNSDSEEVCKDLETMKVQRRQQIYIIEEQMKQKEDKLRRAKLDTITKGEHLQKALPSKSQEQKKLQFKKKLFINKKKLIIQDEEEQYDSETDYDDSYAENVRKLNEEMQTMTESCIKIIRATKFSSHISYKLKYKIFYINVSYIYLYNNYQQDMILSQIILIIFEDQQKPPLQLQLDSTQYGFHIYLILHSLSII